MRMRRPGVTTALSLGTIVTAGGFIGKVTKVADEAAEIEVEIADGVRVKVVRAMISEVRAKGEPVKA